jgi:hypothetical protein
MFTSLKPALEHVGQERFHNRLAPQTVMTLQHSGILGNGRSLFSPRAFECGQVCIMPNRKP